MRLKKYKKCYTPQLSETDCGPAALNMILKYYGSSYSTAFLRELTKTDTRGTNILGIIKAASYLGFETKVVRANMSLFSLKSSLAPFIVHITNNGINHYCVVFEYSKDYVIIGDPNPEIRVKQISTQEFYKNWDGICVFFKLTEAYTKKERDKNIYYLSLIFKHKRLIFSILITSIIISCFNLISAYTLKIILDYIIPNEDYRMLQIISLGLIIMYIFNSIFYFNREIFVTRFGQKLSYNITLEYIKYILFLPLDFFKKRKAGEILSRFNDSSKITDAFGSLIVSGVLDLQMLILTSMFLLFQNYKLFNIVLCISPLYIFLIINFNKKFNQLNYHVMEAGAILDSSVVEGISGIESIKSMASEVEILHKIEKEFDDLLDYSMQFSKNLHFQQSLKLFLDFSLNTLILWLGGEMVVHNKITIGNLMTFIVLLNYFTTPLQNILNLHPKLQTALAADQRLREIYDNKQENFNSSSSEKRLSGSLMIENISFGYNFNENILDNLTLKIDEYEKIALVGMSGSGKSTLIKLINGLISSENTNEKIRFNNHKIKDISLSKLRKFVHVVPQEVIIFSGSLRYNLLLSREDKEISDKQLDKVLELVSLSNFKNSLPEGYDTLLSEFGNNLSGGQKQRIGIARAILSEAEFYIFDESTSNLDVLTEDRIINNLLNMSDKTIIFIVHRLTAARKINNIMVLDSGKIVEKGSHEELLVREGIYFNMVNSLIQNSEK